MLKINFSDKDIISPKTLKFLGFSQDKDGYLTDTKTSERILDSDGQYAEVANFGGVTNGSTIIFKNNLVSLVRIFDSHLAKKA